MNIQPCEYPQRIYNRYLKEVMYVPCGRCNTCISRKAFSKVQMLERESACHKYACFVTLTYNEEFVPVCDFGSYNDVPADLYQPTLPAKSKNTLFSYLAEDLEQFDEKSWKLIQAYDGKVRVLNYEHIKLFIKRIRKKISDDYNRNRNEYSERDCPTLRYWCCGEYGPTTFRPHYHLIIWFDSETIRANIESLLLEGWSQFNRVTKERKPYGRVEWSFVKSSASRYVASYTNCVYNLPSCLTFPAVRPFGIGSRRPPLGSLVQSSETVRKIFFNGVTKLSIPRANGQGASIIPLLPSFKNRLFPKCLRYSTLDSVTRTYAYRLCDYFPSYREAARNQVSQYLKSCYLNLNYDSIIKNYIDVITDEFNDIKPLERALRISFRVQAQANIFDIDITTYVRYIDCFYMKLENERLTNWMQFQSDFSSVYQNKKFDLLFADLEFLNMYYFEPSKINPEQIKAYGFDSLTDLKQFDLLSCFDFKQMVERSRFFVHQTSKTKKKNDYLNAHPELQFFKNI